MKIQDALNIINQNINLQLYITHSHIDDEQACLLADALVNNNSITSIDLSYNQLSAEGAQALAKVLETNQSLNYFSLNHNQVSDAGVQALAKALEANHSLNKLNLRCNQVGDAGAQALAKALEINCSLSKVELGGNQVGVAGAQALARALKVNRSLNSLALWGNQISDAGVQAFTQVLEVNHSLNSLSFPHNRVGEAAAKSFNVAWEGYKIRYQLIQEAAISGNEQELTNYFKEYQRFPSSVLSLLIQYNHEALAMRWEAYWSIADVNYQDKKDNTPLHYAIQLKLENLIAWLLQQSGVALNVVNCQYISPLVLLKNNPELLPKSYTIEDNRLIRMSKSARSVGSN